MIKTYELNNLSLRIEVFTGDITIDDIYNEAKSYFDSSSYKKVKYTIIDFREATTTSITINEVKEYVLWQKTIQNIKEVLNMFI